MYKNYELWLDESGNFENQKNMDRNPSLVGGILIEKENINYNAIENYFKEKDSHACEIKGNKSQTVMPALKWIQEQGAHFVCFENKERVEESSGRALYMRIFTSGIIQLLRELSSEGEGFSLNILAALRIDIHAEREARIPDDEYLKTMEEYVRSAVKHRMLDLHPDTVVNIVIASARVEAKLQFADFVCNARLTRNSRGFSDEDRVVLSSLYEEKYIFSVNENVTLGMIDTYLSEHRYASALLELYTTREQVDYLSVSQKIIERLCHASYKVTQVHLQSFLKDLQRFITMERDFEYSERRLLWITEKLVPHMKEKQIPFLQEFEFDICLYLTELYLQEGDILNAIHPLMQLKATAREMNHKLEHIIRQYQRIQIEAIYDIKCFDAGSAEVKMKMLVEFVENIMILVADENIVRENLTENMQSQYLGNALCLKLLAQIQFQREQPQLYDSMRKDSDTALLQYRYPGELERNLLLRAHFETEHKDFEEALDDLLKSALIQTEERSETQIYAYLEHAANVKLLDRSYFLLYYCELMSEALTSGNSELSHLLHRTLVSHKEIWTFLINSRPESAQLERVDYRKEREHDNILQNILEKEAVPFYHPMELVYWKLATYHALSGNQKASIKWYDRAVKTCYLCSDYLVLRIEGLGILCDRLYHFKDDTKEVKKLVKEIEKRYREIINLPDIPPKTLEFVQQWEVLLLAQEESEYGTIAKALSRKIVV